MKTSVKLLSFLLSLLMLLSLLVSCKNNTGNTETGTKADETDTNQEETTTNQEEEVIKQPSPDAYYIIEAVAQNGRNGLANGWTYDNRFDLTNATGINNSTVYDLSDEKFFRLIRRFDPESDGRFKLEMIINAQSSDEGIYIALCDNEDNKLFYLTAKNGKWVFIGENELTTSVPIVNGGQTEKFGIEMLFDLDQHTASVTINNITCGEIKIPDCEISKLILGTNKKGTGTIGFEYVRLMKNYPLVDRFILGDISAYEGQAPANWEITGDFKFDRISSMRLYDMYSVKADSKAGTASTATKRFDAIDGKLAFEAMILLPEKTDGASFSLLSGDNAIVTFETRDGKIYVGDKMVNDYIANVWQTLHVEADTNTGKADIYVNGKIKATVDFSATSFDGVRLGFTPETDAVMWFDDVEVYPVFEYEDYPEEPQVAESIDYNIGMNVCWLWRDQQSGEGWDATSPFSEFDPYLGFYDEGLRETADWELKWMAEHGIDFIHACWYCPSGNISAPIKEMRHSYAALHDGYMMAKYSNYVDFCIMWENNGQDCTSFEQFREYIWNYWMEYYFSDPRYARLDNKAVLTIWNRSNFEKAFGGAEGTKKAIAFMEKELKAIGYDGIIILASTQGANPTATYTNLANLGYDATYGYHWGANGYDENYQITCNQTNLENSKGILHHIPTVSIGFNDVGRNETRDPIVTVEGHLKVCKSIKNQLSKLNTGTWKDNTLFISTWNEYSEGTYLFPTKSTGFDYLENIRSIFTNDTSDHSALDVRPTEAQIERVTHLYPDNHSPIRWYQFEKADTARAEYIVKVNGTQLSFTFNPQKTDDGDLLVVGEAKTKGFYSAMRLYHEWDRFTGDGVLTLYTYNENKLVFTVGSDKVIVNGAEQALGFTFTIRDGLPQFHIKKLCALLGYKFTEDGNTISIQAATDEEYKTLATKVENQWEFAVLGELEGWKTQQGTSKADKAGLLTVTPSGSDIAVIHDVSFSASKYNVIRVGVKYNAQVVSQSAALFFTTKASTSYSSDKCITAKYDTTSKGEGDTVEVVFILSSNVNFSGTITGIRIDPYTGLAPFDIDYIRCEFDEKYAAENGIIEVDDENQWYFDKNGNKEGWTISNAAYKGVKDGVYHGRANNTDPAIYHTVNFPASNYQILIVGMVYNSKTAAQSSVFYFRTSSDSSWNEAKSVKGVSRIPDDIKEGETYQVVFDLTTCANWKGTITDLRIDPFAMIEDFAIDYIRFYKKGSSEIVNPNAAKPTKPTSVTITDPKNLPDGITVSSESTGTVTMVADPTDASKMVFKVECTDKSSEKYSYLNVHMQFEAGKTYIVSYKLMPLTDINGQSFSKTIIGGNFIYGTVSNPSLSNHTFDAGSDKSSSDKWIEVNLVVTVSGDYTANEKDKFQIWGKFSPATKLGINYLVKDISITPQ